MDSLLRRAEPLVDGGALLAQLWCDRCRQWRYGAPIEMWDDDVVVPVRKEAWR